MQVLHAHYSPDEPGLTFWTETSDAPAPKPGRGRVAGSPKPRPHLFSVAPNFPGEKRRHVLLLRGENWLTEMSTDELRSVIRLRR